MYLKGFEISLGFLSLKNMSRCFGVDVTNSIMCLVSTIPFAFMDTLNLIECYLYPFIQWVVLLNGAFIVACHNLIYLVEWLGSSRDTYCQDPL